MLYKKICHVTLSIYTLLSSPIHSSTYYVKSNPSASYKCPQDETNCRIFCDIADHNNINTYDCNNAANCRFFCDDVKCGESAIINAQNATNLYITQNTTGDQCLKAATINTPNYGNAYFSTFANKGFKEMKVYAGNHTNEIIIDTSLGIDDDRNGEYKQMNVYASTATYVSITIGTNLEWSSASIQCPLHSTYNGSDLAPCVIHATSGLLTDITIIAPEGVPHNFYMDGCSHCNNVLLVCKDVDPDNNSIYPFNNNSTCWWTQAPTMNPVTQPTIHPTIHPAKHTIAPSSTLTSNISTIAPSQAPSYVPSISPTVEPSMEPVYNDGSTTTTEHLSIVVTSREDIPSKVITTDIAVHSGEDLEEGNERYYWGKAKDWVIFSGVFVLFWIIVGGCWWVYTKPVEKAKETRKIIHFMNQSIDVREAEQE